MPTENLISHIHSTSEVLPSHNHSPSDYPAFITHSQVKWWACIIHSQAKWWPCIIHSQAKWWACIMGSWRRDSCRHTDTAQIPGHGPRRAQPRSDGWVRSVRSVQVWAGLECHQAERGLVRPKKFSSLIGWYLASSLGHHMVRSHAIFILMPGFLWWCIKEKSFSSFWKNCIIGTSSKWTKLVHTAVFLARSQTHRRDNTS